MRKAKTLSRHHRKPSSRGGKRGENISIVTKTKHDAWHRLFNNDTPEQIAEQINEIWLDLDFKFVVARRNP